MATNIGTRKFFAAFGDAAAWPLSGRAAIFQPDKNAAEVVAQLRSAGLKCI